MNYEGRRFFINIKHQNEGGIEIRIMSREDGVNNVPFGVIQFESAKDLQIILSDVGIEKPLNEVEFIFEALNSFSESGKIEFSLFVEPVLQAS